MINWYLTKAYWYLHNHSLFNWSFTNAKLILIDSLNQITIYQYLTITYQYFVCARLHSKKQHLTDPDWYLNNRYRLCLNREWYWNQTKEQFVSLIYFLLRPNCHIQYKVLYNGENVRRHFVVSLFPAMFLKFITKSGNTKSIFYLDKISADS